MSETDTNNNTTMNDTDTSGIERSDKLYMGDDVGLIGKIKRRIYASKQPHYQKRTSLTAKPHKKAIDGKRWVTIYRDYLAGIGDDTVCYKRDRVGTQLVDDDDIDDSVVMVPMVCESFVPSTTDTDQRSQ